MMNPEFTSGDRTPATVGATEPRCIGCGGQAIDAWVKVTLWSGGQLVVVEDVPARTCEACQEQYYDEATSEKILRLVNAGFPKNRERREITVPVFSIDDSPEPESECA